MNLFKAHPSGHIHAEKSELLHLSEGNKPIIQSGEMALIGRDFIGLFSHSFHGTGHIYGQALTCAPRCNATSFGMVQMYCE